MTDRPIIFSGEMVRAILDGRKTQTRRPVIRYGKSSVKRVLGPTKDGFFDFIFPEERDYSKDGIGHLVKCPFGMVGDRLWVRETFTLTVPGNRPIYRESWKSPEGIMWTPSLHMPRWASRITLEITEVRVQRVQEISYNDCEDEGMDHQGDGKPCCICFEVMWNQLYTKKGFGWDANPWVWVITFRRVEG